MENNIYTTAKSLLGKHLTLDPNVPNEVGCAEAISYILKQCGYTIPEKGIAGTYSFLEWFLAHPELFKEVEEYTVSAIILSATSTGNGKIPGHIGVCAHYGIMSNNSDSGLFLELWDIAKWTQYYEVYGGIKTRYFLAI